MAGARIIVVGAGFAGLTAAVRLAKLRHDVTVLEATDRIGGRLLPHVVDGHAFALCTPHVTLPGVFRDLFRKSGRTMDRALDFQALTGRTHYFDDGPALDLPLGHRADQVDALAARFGDDGGWTPWLDTLEPTWDLLRRLWLERIPHGTRDIARNHRRRLEARRRLHRAARRRLDEDELEAMLVDRHVIAGHDPTATPAFVSVVEYLERTFGLWSFAGGTAGLAQALHTRAGERRVTLRTGVRAHELIETAGRVTGVRTDDGAEPADVVVWCAPPPPGHVSPAMPRIAAARTFCTLDPQAAGLLPVDAVVHADPPLRFYREGAALTIEHRGGQDPLVALARCGLDLRPHVEARFDLSPVDLAVMGHWGYGWNRWTTAAALPGVAPPPGLFFAGAGAHPGGSLELIGLATATVAAAVGPASR